MLHDQRFAIILPKGGAFAQLLVFKRNSPVVMVRRSSCYKHCAHAAGSTYAMPYVTVGDLSNSKEPRFLQHTSQVASLSWLRGSIILNQLLCTLTRTTQETYLVIFVSMAMRIVHIEVVEALNSSLDGYRLPIIEDLLQETSGSTFSVINRQQASCQIPIAAGTFAE